MRKFTYILAAALTLTTSCKISDGSTPNPMAVGNIIAEQSINTYAEELTTLDYALICDYYLSTNSDKSVVDIDYAFLRHFNTHYNYKVIRNNNEISIIYAHVEPSYLIVTFSTDGKLLSEGGVWTTPSHNASTIEPDNNGGYIYKCEEEIEQFKLHISNIAINNIDGISYDINGDTSHIFNGRTPKSAATLTTHIVEPLSYKCYSNQPIFLFERGQIEAICEDSRYNTVDEVHITFTHNNNAVIRYLGQTGSITYNGYY